MHNQYSPDSIPVEAQDIIRALKMPCLFSRSIKIGVGSISHRRWLLTLPDSCSSKKNIDTALCVLKPYFKSKLDRLRNCGMFPTALHIGYDFEHGEHIWKLYYEFDANQNDLVFLAIKESIHKCQIHSYRITSAETTLPSIPLPEAVQKNVFHFIEGLHQQAALLEVTAESSIRKSLDINLANVSHDNIDKILILNMIIDINVSALPYTEQYIDDPSHLAVGVQPDGTPFLTLYGQPAWIEPANCIP